MLDLRFPWFWMGIGWLLVAAVCAGSLLPASIVAVSANDKVLHFVSYLVLTVWFSGLYSRFAHYLIIAAIVIAFGALLDVLQTTTATRYLDVFDVLANAAGALAGLVLSYIVLGGWCRHAERWIVR